MPLVGIAAILGIIAVLVYQRRKQQPTPPVGPMTVEEVQEMLAELAPGAPDATDYANSIVDFLKVLRQESSFVNREHLWKEFGHAEVYGGSAAQNIQLHADVMKAVRERKIVP